MLLGGVGTPQIVQVANPSFDLELVVDFSATSFAHLKQVGLTSPQVYGLKFHHPTVDGWNPKQPAGMYKTL